MKKMGREFDNNPRKGTFGTNISFDIDETTAPVRRRVKEENHKEIDSVEDNDTLTGCPGCGSEISHDEWLDCLVGFVSGAHEFEIGNPVRARIVQNLRNQTAKINLPQPKENWELAVVGKLMAEIEKIVLAEVNRNQQKQVASAGLSDIERNELIAETEARTINSMAVEIQEALIAELTPILEQDIRAQVEQELWQQFEQEWKNRSANNLGE
tara:strand:+ start:388 stop:1023 length:636 start_codon:yes stop_codon:yes gene_type:complete